MKHLFTIFISSIIYATTLYGNGSPHWHLEGSNEGWNNEWLALKYFHNSELQRQWAWHLLASYHFQEAETILDFGCGDGKITAEVSHFIPKGHIRGVDLSHSMITLAKRCFPNAHYSNLFFGHSLDVDFNDVSQNETYDLIYSFCVFHLVPNPIQILNNLRLHLKDDGKLLLVIPAGNNPAFFQAANEMFNKYSLKAPWDKKDTKSNITMRTKDGCIHCLNEAGFEVKSIADVHTPTAFFNKQELIEYMMGTVTANWHIPLEIAELFFNELVDRMAELDVEVIDHSGAYHLKLSRLEVIAQPSTKL